MMAPEGPVRGPLRLLALAMIITAALTGCVSDPAPTGSSPAATPPAKAPAAEETPAKTETTPAKAPAPPPPAPTKAAPPKADPAAYASSAFKYTEGAATTTKAKAVADVNPFSYKNPWR